MTKNAIGPKITAVVVIAFRSRFMVVTSFHRVGGWVLVR
jgi:hypothetical protein